MPKVIPRARMAGSVALAATAMCLALASTASAGTPMSGEHYCPSLPSPGYCLTYAVNIPDWTYYTRAEMQGYHCAAGPNSQGRWCGTANYVYSACWSTPTNPKQGWGYNGSGVTRNINVIVFHATSNSDCNLYLNDG